MAIYRRFTKSEKEIINNHLVWVRGVSTGVRANFSNMDLSGADFSGLNMTRANFKGANLSEANLSRGNFSYCDMNTANLDNSLFFKTIAYGTKMSNCSAKDVNFTNAFLKCADLSSTDLLGSMFNNTELTYTRVHSHLFLRSKCKNCYLEKIYIL